MGRGHPINLYSVLKPLLHTECQQACLTSLANMCTLLLELVTINQLQRALHGQWHMNAQTTCIQITEAQLTWASQQIRDQRPHYFKYRALKPLSRYTLVGKASKICQCSSETLESCLCLFSEVKVCSFESSGPQGLFHSWAVNSKHRVTFLCSPVKWLSAIHHAW